MLGQTATRAAVVLTHMIEDKAYQFIVPVNGQSVGNMKEYPDGMRAELDVLPLGVDGSVTVAGYICEPVKATASPAAGSA